MCRPLGWLRRCPRVTSPRGCEAYSNPPVASDGVPAVGTLRLMFRQYTASNGRGRTGKPVPPTRNCPFHATRLKAASHHRARLLVHAMLSGPSCWARPHRLGTNSAPSRLSVGVAGHRPFLLRGDRLRPTADTHLVAQRGSSTMETGHHGRPAHRDEKSSRDSSVWPQSLRADLWKQCAMSGLRCLSREPSETGGARGIGGGTGGKGLLSRQKSQGKVWPPSPPMQRCEN